MSETIIRCTWCGEDPIYVKYHDEEWGHPVTDDRTLFEFLTLAVERLDKCNLDGKQEIDSLLILSLIFVFWKELAHHYKYILHTMIE